VLVSTSLSSEYEFELPEYPYTLALGGTLLKSGLPGTKDNCGAASA
jgi:hypothetical protein